MTETELSLPSKDGEEGDDYLLLELELDEMFANRYTEQDEEYMKHLSIPTPTQPCVHNWYIKPKRTYDWSRNNPSHPSHRGAREWEPQESYRGRGDGYGSYDRGRGRGGRNYYNRDRDGYYNKGDRSDYGYRSDRVHYAGKPHGGGGYRDHRNHPYHR